MILFLFEQYGYYPKDFVNNCFSIDKWQFKLIETEYDEKEIEKMGVYSDSLRFFFQGKGAYIIKNKNQNYISYYGGRNYVLICCYKYEVNLDDFKKFQEIFFDEKYSINLASLKEAWEIRMMEIEEKGLSALKIESSHYCSNLEKCLFCLGMCQNAIQYLGDIIYDYGSIIQNAAITHKRINTLSSFEFFNPFNFVVDSPMRDYVELYRNECVFLEELIEIFSYFNFGVVDASLFMARLLYPSNVFDVIEDVADCKVYDSKIKYDINKELLKIKKVYLFFREKYNIHPIWWLDDLNLI